MSWLRLSDDFTTHPKLLELTRSDRWRWVELLCLAARHRTAGQVSDGMLRRADIAPRLVADLLMLRLLERNGDNVLVIHDWDAMNPPPDRTNRERQARHRAAKRETSPAASLQQNAKPVPPPNTPAQDTSGIKPERNALPDPLLTDALTGYVTDPVPVPVTTVIETTRARQHDQPLTEADERTREARRVLAGRRRSSSPGTLAGAVGDELERLRGVAGAPRGWEGASPEGDAAA